MNEELKDPIETFNNHLESKEYKAFQADFPEFAHFLSIQDQAVKQVIREHGFFLSAASKRVQLADKTIKRIVMLLATAFLAGGLLTASAWWLATPQSLYECIADKAQAAHSDRGAILAANACKRLFRR